MGAEVAGAEHQPGFGDPRRGERAVRRDHRGHPAQPRVVPGQERGLPGLAAPRAVRRRGRAAGAGAGTGAASRASRNLACSGRLADAPARDRRSTTPWPSVPMKLQRHRVIAVGGLDDRGDQQRGSLVRDVAGDVEAQLRGAWRRHQALPARVDERQAGGVRLLEDRPELAGLAAGQLEVPLVAAVRVAVSVVGGSRGGARPVQGVQLVQQADVRGRVLVAQQQVVEPGPGQVPGHPGAAAAARHQPGLQPEPRLVPSSGSCRV